MISSPYWRRIQTALNQIESTHCPPKQAIDDFNRNSYSNVNNTDYEQGELRDWVMNPMVGRLFQETSVGQNDSDVSVTE